MERLNSLRKMYALYGQMPCITTRQAQVLLDLSITLLILHAVDVHVMARNLSTLFETKFARIESKANRKAKKSHHRRAPPTRVHVSQRASLPQPQPLQVTPASQGSAAPTTAVTTASSQAVLTSTSTVGSNIDEQHDIKEEDEAEVVDQEQQEKDAITEQTKLAMAATIRELRESMKFVRTQIQQLRKEKQLAQQQSTAVTYGSPYSATGVAQPPPQRTGRPGRPPKHPKIEDTRYE
jgi:hypothetical protein